MSFLTILTLFSLSFHPYSLSAEGKTSLASRIQKGRGQVIPLWLYPPIMVGIYILGCKKKSDFAVKTPVQGRCRLRTSLCSKMSLELSTEQGHQTDDHACFLAFNRNLGFRPEQANLLMCWGLQIKRLLAELITLKHTSLDDCRIKGQWLLCLNEPSSQIKHQSWDFHRLKEIIG